MKVKNQRTHSITNRILMLAILALLCLAAFLAVAIFGAPGATAYAETVDAPAYEVGVTADGGAETGYDDFVTAFNAAETLSSAEGTRVTVKLYGAVQFTEQLSVSKEADITLDLNGFALRRRNLQVEENTFDLPYYPDSSVDTGMIFEIRGKLTLDDSAPERIHTNADREKIGVPLYTKLPAGGLVTGSYMTHWNYGGLFNVLGGELTLNGGKIYGNSGTSGGTNSAVVYLTCGESYNTSKLTMNGGEISGNFFPAIVRGQRKDYATFDMSGGRIANNGIYCEDLIDDSADYGKTDVNNVFRNYDLAVTNYSMNVTFSGDAYLYDNYYVPSKYAYFHKKVNAQGQPTYPESYWDMEEEKALKVGTDGGYGDYEDRQAYDAHMQPNMALYVYNTYDLSVNASFSIAGNFTGKLGLYDYRELLGSEKQYDRSAKIIAYKLLPGADMNGTVEIVDANHASFKGDDPSYYYLPDGVTAPTERYDAVREGLNCVLYRKFDVSVSQSGNDYYQEEENGFPSAAATATTLGLDGKIVSVEGTLTYEKQFQQGKQTVGYTFTPTLKNLYGIRMGSFDVTGQAVRELKVTHTGSPHPSGTKLSDIQNEFTVSLIYQNGHTVALTPSQYTLAFGEGTGSSRTELRGGSNAIYATYVGVSGATYQGSVTVSVDGVGFEVYNSAYIGDNTQVTVYNTFDAAIGAALNLPDSVIVMYEDVNAKNPITIPASKRITLDLNGHVINLSDLPATFDLMPVYNKGYYYKVTQSPFITVIGANSSFTISDSSPDAAHTNADLPRGGVLTGMRYNSVVRVENGYFMLGGGTIYKNVIDRLLSYDDGKHKYGIEDNPILGAAINLSGGDAEIGTYAAITANGVMSRSTAAVDGHVVLDNSETVRGGAVYVSENSRLTVYGKIEGNAASTVGGIYIQGGDVVLKKTVP